VRWRLLTVLGAAVLPSFFFSFLRFLFLVHLFHFDRASPSPVDTGSLAQAAQICSCYSSWMLSLRGFTGEE
jgi:hypothetical protein